MAKKKGTICYYVDSGFEKIETNDVKTAVDDLLLADLRPTWVMVGKKVLAFSRMSSIKQIRNRVAQECDQAVLAI